MGLRGHASCCLGLLAWSRVEVALHLRVLPRCVHIALLATPAPQVSTVLGAAVPAEREQNAWTEGVAIWVAVFVVSLVGTPARSVPHMPQPGRGKAVLLQA